MPATGYTIGRDISVDIISRNGPLRFATRTGFEPKQETTEIKVKGSDGIVRTAYLPDGWTGTIDFDRFDARLDDYFAGVEADYYAGKDVESVSITETIIEKTGALTQYRYLEVALRYEAAGARGDPDSTVKQKISWAAARRIKIA
jgi:hypothetical protein